MTRVSYGDWIKSTGGSVLLLFALALVPIMMIVGTAVDYSLYMRAQSQLNLAADAAALHAARVASQGYSNGLTTTAADTQAGQTAGLQWFTAQLGTLPNVSVPASNIVVSVVYTVSPGGFTATVSYTGTVSTTFSKMFGYSTLPISGTATSVISNSYVEVVMMIDNSSSMLIGSSTNDIVKLEQATMCSTQAATAGQNMGSNYSWVYPTNSPAYGYGGGTPPPSTPIGSCDSRYTGASSACFYPSALTTIINSSGTCVAGTTAGLSGVPQAPCAFACHNSSTSNDYYGLARSLGVTLRLDVILNAAENVISTLETDEQTPNQFSVGVYQFNTALERVYPTSGTSEAGTDLATALTLTEAITTPVVNNAADTDFVDSATSLTNSLTAAGDGTGPTKPLKNIFIVTDGLEDSQASGTRVMEAMNASDENNICQKFKALGFTVYVLYTPYLPLPNQYYLSNIKQIAEPTGTNTSSTLVTSLQACASSTSDFYQASDATAINTALQAMLKSALNSPGRISK